MLALVLISRAGRELPSSGTCRLAQNGRGRIPGAGGWTGDSPLARRDRPKGATGHVRHCVAGAGMVRHGIGRAQMDRVLAQADSGGVRWLDCLATRKAVPFCAAPGFPGPGAVGVPLRQGIIFPAVRMVRAIQTGHRHGKRAGPSTGPVFGFRPSRQGYSRLPMNCSRNMNRLMKSRYSCSAPMIAALPSHSLSPACACCR